ncbi:hypothetical protein Pfo_011234 [Paulownia fortunei]|nr:hypothetical protein Pfo_011234 [Paulownia fortunei]
MTAASETESPSPRIFIPEEWSNAADAIASSSVAFPCSGKTTFSRHLLNVLLQRHKKVAYLDTDVGQTEFTPPDLTIPCLKTPERDPTTYLAYLSSLYEHYLIEYCMNNKIENQGKAGFPLVINTAGWVKGVGYKILLNMLKYMPLIHVLKIQISATCRGIFGTGTKGCMPSEKFACMAYFRQCFPSNKTTSTIKELARALAAYIFITIGVCNVFPLGPKNFFYSLNATIVALAVSSVSERLPQCVGLGIVRAIDTFRGVLHVITPVPQQILDYVDLLLQGFIQLSTSLLQVHVVHAYFCVSPFLVILSFFFSLLTRMGFIHLPQFHYNT